MWRLRKRLRMLFPGQFERSNCTCSKQNKRRFKCQIHCPNVPFVACFYNYIAVVYYREGFSPGSDAFFYDITEDMAFKCLCRVMLQGGSVFESKKLIIAWLKTIKRVLFETKTDIFSFIHSKDFSQSSLNDYSTSDNNLISACRSLAFRLLHCSLFFLFTLRLM